MEIAANYRYAAFISYSSKDASFARRLHRLLERFRVPGRLAARGIDGSIARNRIYPIFRDREELPSGDLGAAIHEALEKSATLIVICSPSAANSRWVNHEVEAFKALGRGSRIYPIIAEDVAEEADLSDLLPAALTHNGAEPGASAESLAADARKRRDGFRPACLKVIAGIININAGALRSRDAMRRRRQVFAASGIALAAIASISIGAIALDIQASRNRLSTYAERLAGAGLVRDAVPFAIAGVAQEGALLTLQGDRADAVLAQAGKSRLIADLRPFQNFKLSADGKVLVGFKIDGTGSVFDASSGRLRYDLPSLGPIESAVLTSDGSSLFSPLAEDKSVLYQLGDKPVQTDFLAIAGFRFSDDGSRLFVQTKDGQAMVYDLTGRTSNIDLGVNRNYAVTGRSAAIGILANDGKITLRSGDDLADAITVDGPANVRSIRLSDDGAALFALRADNTGRIYWPHEQRSVSVGPFGNPYNVLLSPAGNAVVIVDETMTGTLFLARESPKAISLGKIQNLLFSADGSTLFVVEEDNEGAEYSISAEGSRTSLGPLLGFAPVSRDADYRAVGADLLLLIGDKTATLVDLKRSARRISLTDPADLQAMTLSGDGKTLFLHRMNNSGAIYDIDPAQFQDGRANKIADLGDLGIVQSASISENGAVLATLGPNGNISVLNTSRAATSPGDSPSLVLEVCKASGEAMLPFPPSLRDPGAVRSEPGEQAIHRSLLGRPWNPCDWRGLGAGAEGWAQWKRLMTTVVMGEPGQDFRCGEIDAEGHTTETRLAACRAARVPDALIAPSKTLQATAR